MTRIQIAACRFIALAAATVMWVSILMAISGCQTTIRPPALLNQMCDPSGECHEDKPLQIHRPVILHFADDPGALHPTQKDAYAFALIKSGPFCQIWLPQPLGWSDGRFQSLMWHELRHCAEGSYHG